MEHPTRARNGKPRRQPRGCTYCSVSKSRQRNQDRGATVRERLTAAPNGSRHHHSLTVAAWKDVATTRNRTSGIVIDYAQWVVIIAAAIGARICRH